VQSSIWLFGLPIICRKYWDDVFGSMSPLVAELTLTMSTTCLIVMYNLVMLLIYYLQLPLFEQFKIQQDHPWPWLDKREDVRQAFWKLSTRSLKLSLLNIYILLPLMTISKIWLFGMMTDGSLAESSSFHTDDESWPSVMKNCSDMILLAVLHEFGLYFTHRLMHTYPSLYKYHKVHHEHKHNTTLASQHNHPVDFILSIGGPLLLAVGLVNPHSSTLFQFLIWTVFANMDDHVGYSFPWSPVRWFPLSAATEEHEFHHSKNLGCFGSKLSIYNTLLGGYERYTAYTQRNPSKQKI